MRFLIVVTFTLGFLAAIVFGEARADYLYPKDDSSFFADVQSAPLLSTPTGTRTQRTATPTATVTVTSTPSVTPTATSTPIVPSVGITVRAAWNNNSVPGSVQTLLYGGEVGMTITNVRGDDLFQVDFPAGTWVNPKTGKICNFIPAAVGAGGSAVSWSTNPDGSGTMQIYAASSSVLSPAAFIAVSADC